MKDEKEGYVYIITNEYMPGLIKIGKTVDLKQRIKNLYSTGVPGPFTFHYAVKVSDRHCIEKLTHDAFADFRINGREFFKLQPERAVAALKLTGGEPQHSIEGKTVEGAENVQQDGIRQRKERLNFSKLNLPPNAELIFTRDENIKCKIINEKEVEYHGTNYALSALALKLLQEKGAKYTNVNGFLYFKYNDTILAELRED